MNRTYLEASTTEFCKIHKNEKIKMDYTDNYRNWYGWLLNGKTKIKD